MYAGMGAICSGADSISFDPLCFFASLLSAPPQSAQSTAADIYQGAQYGTIPLPVVATPPVVSTADQSTGADPNETWLDIATGWQANDATATDQAIQTATDNGTYNQNGNFPISATDLSNAVNNPLGSSKSILIWLGLGAVAFVLVTVAVKR